MTKALEDSLRQQKKDTQQTRLRISGTLGIPIGGQQRVEVPSRNAFVYVKLRDNQNEVIQAYNNEVAPSYGLPVIVEWQHNRYVVVGVDTIRYQNNWNSNAPFLARHGNTHSFNPDSSGGGDIVWVHSRQFMPALVFPSGTLGSPSAIMAPYTLKNSDGSWKYIGTTGTPSLLPYRPTNNQAVMVLVYLDTVSGNPYLLVGSGSYFSANITGTAEITPYIPSLTNSDFAPLGAVRLVSGTTTIKWDNIYDTRQFLYLTATGTSGGGAGTVAVQDEGVPKGSVGTFNFVGPNVDVSVSGSVARVFVTGSTGGGATNLTGTSVGTPNRALVSDSSGFITTDSRIGWGLNGSNGFLEFGINVAGKESNAGKVGYALFDNMFDIIGANYAGSGTRWVRIYDALYSDLVQVGNLQHNGQRNIWVYLNGTGTVVPPISAPEKTFVTGTDWFLGTDSGFNSYRMPVSGLSYSHTPVEGWIPCAETWTRTGNYTFTLEGDRTSKYGPGTKVRYNDGSGTEYGTVVDATHSGGTTTVTLATNSDYAMASTPSETYISYVEPPDFPSLFNWSATCTGFSSQPTGTYRFKIIGGLIYVEVIQTVNGTSNATTFGVPPPFTYYLSANAIVLMTISGQDNSVALTAPGTVAIISNTNYRIDKAWNVANGWTNSNGKRISFTGWHAYR